MEEREQIVSRLHETFSARIYYLALRELKLPEAAEDVRNETLIRVMESVRSGKVDSLDALPAFVAGTARNVIREFRRKDARFSELGDLDLPADPVPPPPDPAVNQAIEQTLRRLKPRERDFLRLYYYEELSKEEISSRLGIIPDRVRLIKSRALKNFRDFYQRLSGAATS